MKKLFLFLIAFVLLGFSMGLANSIEASSSVNITVNGIFDGSPEFTPVNTTGTRGGTYSYDGASTPSGHAFAFWIVNGVVRKDLAVDHVFTITSKMTLQIVFTPTSPTKFVAVFIDSNGAYIGREYTTGGTVSDASLTMPASRPGFVVDSENKWTSIEGSTSITNITANSVFVLNYEEDETPIGAVTLSVTGGTASISNPIPFNSLVTVTANAAPEGQVFSGWIENGVIVSYSQEYKYSALSNRVLTATYSESVTPQALVSISNAIAKRTNYFTYVGQVYIPAGQSLIEYGFIFHASSTELLTLNTSGITVAQGSSIQSLTNEFVVSFSKSSHKNIRGYAILKDGETELIIYSTVKFDYHEEFTSKGLNTSTANYAGGTFTAVNGSTWTYGAAIDWPDYRIEGNGIVLRRSSDAYLDIVVTGGVGYFQFQYMKASTGSNSREIEVIVDGNQYTISPAFGAFSGADYTVYTYNIVVNQSGTFTIRIKLTLSNTTNRHVTIDNVKWTNYSE